MTETETEVETLDLDNEILIRTVGTAGALEALAGLVEIAETAEDIHRARRLLAAVDRRLRLATVAPSAIPALRRR